MKKQTSKNIFYRLITICLVGFLLYSEMPFVSFPNTDNSINNQISLCNDDDSNETNFNE